MEVRCPEGADFFWDPVVGVNIVYSVVQQVKLCVGSPMSAIHIVRQRILLGPC